jgi:dihydropteroate synthase
MGIINATPDSFYPASRWTAVDAIVEQAALMLEQGADLLDIGGQSSRPGAEQVTVSEELKRVIEPIEGLHANFPRAIISIDTYRSLVATEAVAAGASMVNDVGAGNLDQDMLRVVGGLGVPYVCVHMKGTPATMQQHAVYADVCLEVMDFFISKIAQCHAAGIRDVIVDPGFGFSKNSKHNFALLKHLSLFKSLNCPILIGLSRKSTIYKLLGISAEDALNGTTVLNTVGLLAGAQILRVHDVKQAVEAVKLLQELKP